MKKTILFNPLIIYIFIICLVAIEKAFALKSTVFPSIINVVGHQEYVPEGIKPNIQFNVIAQAKNNRIEEVIAETDSIEFNVEVVQPRKFFLSFHMKREETFFIKIYDVIGNLIHHEVVSKKGRFRKQYDLSKYKTDLYVIEVGTGTEAKIKRLFLG